MPHGVVKTKRDEKKWNKAKSIAKKQYGIDEGSKDFYAIVTGIYKNMKKSLSKVKAELLQKAVEIIALYADDPTSQKDLIKSTYMVLYDHLSSAKKATDLKRSQQPRGRV